MLVAQVIGRLRLASSNRNRRFIGYTPRSRGRVVLASAT